MFVIFLEFADNKASAGAFMEGHMAWLQRGFEDGVFMLAGSLQPDRGGAILAHGTTLAELEARLAEDPFVAEKVVTASVAEIAASRSDDRLKFLLG